MNHVIKYAESEDGITWIPRDGSVIEGANDKEYAFTIPSILHDSHQYHMWYAFRGDAYRIGYACSDDGITWARDDEQCGLKPTGEGWESESVAYPFVFEHGGHRYMLYNGNDYGRTGFGLAKWVNG